MAVYDEIRAKTWYLLIPKGWVEQERTDRGLHFFESDDGSRGLCISAWNVKRTEHASAQELAESFLATDLRQLRRMEGYAWEVLDTNIVVVGSMAIAVADSYAAAQKYRIACKILSRPPNVIRASFHDYACDDLAASRDYFRPVIESLLFYEPVQLPRASNKDCQARRTAIVLMSQQA